METLSDEYFDKKRLDPWFKFSGKLLCTFEEGKVSITDGEFTHNLDHIKTPKQWRDLHFALTGNQL